MERSFEAPSNVRILKNADEVCEAAERASERERLLARELERRAHRFDAIAAHERDSLAS